MFVGEMRDLDSIQPPYHRRTATSCWPRCTPTTPRGDRPHRRRLPLRATPPDPAAAGRPLRDRLPAPPSEPLRQPPGAAFEVLVANHAVRNLVREGREPAAPQRVAPAGRWGCRLEESLSGLVAAGEVSYDVAVGRASPEGDHQPKPAPAADERFGGSYRPDLPYRVLAGVVPCGDGWLMLTGKLQGVTLSPMRADRQDVPRLLDYRPTFDIVALHAPIGLLADGVPGGRACDREARRLLGPQRAPRSTRRPAGRCWPPTTGSTSPSASAPSAGDAAPRRRGRPGDRSYHQRPVYEIPPSSASSSQRRPAAEVLPSASVGRPARATGAPRRQAARIDPPSTST